MAPSVSPVAVAMSRTLLPSAGEAVLRGVRPAAVPLAGFVLDGPL